MNLKPPRITFDQIRAKADGIRCLFKDKALPLDILAATEFDLKYEIRPAKNLRDKGNTDALLLRSEKVIFVDEGFLMDDRQQDSVRFSVAFGLSPKRISIRIAHENLWARLIAPRL